MNSRTASEFTISIVIPSLNSGPYIGRAIDSVLNQGMPAQIIVQDGGSKDDTLGILNRFGDQIEVYSEPDLGQSDALNRGIAKAHGDYIGWLNADDLYSRDAFGLLWSSWCSHPNSQLYYGDFVLVDENDNVLKQYSVGTWNRKRFFSRGCYPFSGATFFHRSLFTSETPFAIDLRYAMDLDFYLSLPLDVTHVKLEGTVGQFRMHEGSKTGSRPWKNLAETKLVLFREAAGTPALQARAGWTVAKGAIYLASRPVWLSDRWLSVRPRKDL